MVFVWHHSEGKPPEWDFPTMPEIGHADWSEPRTFELELAAHVQETHENNNDPVHFQFVHRMVQEQHNELHYSADGRHYQMVTKSEQQPPFGTFEMSLIRDSWGLGHTAVRSEGVPDAGLLMYSSTTPIDDARVMSRWRLTCTDNLVDLAGEEFMNGLTQGVMQDFPIWQNKVYRANPVLCEADEYLRDFRKWVRQFYTDPA